MPYIIDGTTILAPSSGQWTPRRAISITGEGRPIYPDVREFRLRWQLMPIDRFDEIYGAWENVQATGTSVASLPDLLASTYVFREFSGCFLQEPTVGEYFQEYVTNVALTITNIKI
jgi:hypothetical protein